MEVNNNIIEINKTALKFVIDTISNVKILKESNILKYINNKKSYVGKFINSLIEYYNRPFYYANNSVCHSLFYSMTKAIVNGLYQYDLFDTFVNTLLNGVYKDFNDVINMFGLLKQSGTLKELLNGNMHNLERANVINKFNKKVFEFYNKCGFYNNHSINIVGPYANDLKLVYNIIRDNEIEEKKFYINYKNNELITKLFNPVYSIYYLEYNLDNDSFIESIILELVRKLVHKFLYELFHFIFAFNKLRLAHTKLYNYTILKHIDICKEMTRVRTYDSYKNPILFYYKNKLLNENQINNIINTSNLIQEKIEYYKIMINDIDTNDVDNNIKYFDVDKIDNIDLLDYISKDKLSIISNNSINDFIKIIKKSEINNSSINTILYLFMNYKINKSVYMPSDWDRFLSIVIESNNPIITQFKCNIKNNIVRNITNIIYNSIVYDIKLSKNNNVSFKFRFISIDNKHRVSSFMNSINGYIRYYDVLFEIFNAIYDIISDKSLRNDSIALYIYNEITNKFKSQVLNTGDYLILNGYFLLDKNLRLYILNEPMKFSSQVNLSIFEDYICCIDNILDIIYKYTLSSMYLDTYTELNITNCIINDEVLKIFIKGYVSNFINKIMNHIYLNNDMIRLIKNTSDLYYKYFPVNDVNNKFFINDNRYLIFNPEFKYNKNISYKCFRSIFNILYMLDNDVKDLNYLITENLITEHDDDDFN